MLDTCVPAAKDRTQEGDEQHYARNARVILDLRRAEVDRNSRTVDRLPPRGPIGSRAIGYHPYR